MKRFFRVSVIIIPVTFLVIYLLKERSPFGGKNTSFAVPPGTAITRIEFTCSGKNLTLERKEDQWFVNKKQETRKSSIMFILKILNEMQIKSPVTPELFDKEIIANGISPVKVKVYSGSRTVRSFLVFKTSSNTYGNIMKLSEGSKPYIVFVPGNEVEIGSAFTLNELFWQPYTVFDLLPSEIYSVTFENLSDSSSSFRIKNENRTLSLYMLNNQISGWDTTRVVRYITYFINIPFETWAFDLPESERDEIIKSQPLFRITVISSDGEKKILSLWERSVEENGLKKKDTDRLWGKTNQSNEIFVMRYTDIDPLIKKRSYFFPG